MNAGIAKIVFLAIMAAGVTMWAVSPQRALRLGRPARRSEAGFFVDDRPSSAFEWQSGRLTLRGNREMVSKAVVRSLLRVHFGMLARVFKIQQPEDGRVVLKKVGPLLCNLPPGLYFTEAEITFQDLSPGTLDLSHTRVTDAGMKHLSGLKGLKCLSLQGTKVTDEGLKAIAGLDSLEVLYLAETAIAGQSLARLSALKQLESLVVDHTQITDSDMASLVRLTKLRRLVLNHTHVGDSGLHHLAVLAKLQDIDVFRTHVTAQGVAQLQKPMPQTRISR